MAAVCKLLSFANIFLAICIRFCVVVGCEVGKCDLPMGCQCD